MFYQKRFRKVLSALLAFAMLFTCAGVFAIDADGTTSTGDIEVNAKVEPNLNLEAGLETDNVEDLRIPEDFETVDEPVLEADVLKEISANLGVSPGEKAGRKTSTYDYPIHPDPNLVTDEEFFGKWNGEKWTVKPYFNYEGYPDLEFVEEAVKAGSYDEAKVALMNYYVELEAKRDRPKKTTTSKTDILNAHMLEENFMYNIRSGMIITDIVKFGPEPKEVPIDITDHISNKKGISKQIAFVLTATNMDGSKIRINSDDNPNFKPYINIVVNGTSLKVPVEYGTYISAGANVSKNYCTEDYLYAQESGQPLDSNSKRIYIKADIDMLKTNDVLETATLNLYGCNDGGTDEKELAVFKTDDTAWEEDNLKWNKSGLLQMMFSYDQLDTMPWVQPEYGTYRYEEELFRFDTWLDKLVATYNTTGDEKYAYTALRWVVDYIKVRGSNPSHKKLLDRAVRMQVIPGYFLELINCRSMTPEVFTTILKYMWAMGNASIPLKGDANWGTSECQGLYTLCVNFAEFNDSPKWFDAVGARYDVLCDQQLLDDMSCHEIPLGYTDYTLNTLIGAKKVA
ncbi:MAG: heparinase II/III family protein, partial [Oscillospiraceae bacterium]